MKYWLAQINNRVWDLWYNEARLYESFDELSSHSDIIWYSESYLLWYPPQDLIDDIHTLRQQKQILYKLKEKISSTWRDLTVLLWFIDYDETVRCPSWWIAKYNSCAIINPYEIKTYRKRLLPNYDVFNERRYFQPWTEWTRFKFWQELIWAMTICEDIWDEWYKYSPIWDYSKKNNFSHIFNISWSPFYVWKHKIRYELIKRHVRETWKPFIYQNQVWAQWELIFDWTSMIMNKEWELIYVWNSFEEDIRVVDLNCPSHDSQMLNLCDISSDKKYRDIFKAIKLWLSDYLEKSWIKNVVIWVSWWIDSALSLYLLSSILPKERIKAVFIPSCHSKLSNLVFKLWENLWIDIETIPIDSMMSIFNQTFENSIWVNLAQKKDITYKNVQARLRWMILMSLANMYWWIVINNTNKTESFLWYWTLYWDLIWWLGLIWDLNKKEIYEFVRFINKEHWFDIIPNWIIQTPPADELIDDSTDPFDYELISAPVDDLWFWENPIEVSKRYWIELDEIMKFQRLIKQNEYKRYQSPPFLKYQKRSIWIWRQFPIVSWR